METCKRLIRKTLLGVGVWLLLSGVGFGLEPRGEEEVKSALSAFTQQAREHRVDWRIMNGIREKYGVALVPHLERYLSDPNEFVRWHVYSSMVILGVDTKNVTGRQRIVHDLLTGVRDDVKNRSYLAKWLLRFWAADFSKASRVLVEEQVSRALASGGDPNIAMGANLRKHIVLLAGVADLRSELGALERFILGEEVKLRAKHSEYMQGVREEIASNGGWQRLSKYRKKVYSRMLGKQYWQNSLVWSALRARARMGVKEDIARCIELVRSHPDEDYKVVRLLRELSYVRQPEVVDYLYEYLKSDKMEEYKGRDVISTSYAQRAAKALGKMLRGFPHKKNYGPDKETIEHCRKWMAEQKQWDIIR